MHTPTILYEDDAVLVCVKPHGVPVQSRKIGAQDLESILKNHIAEAGNAHKGAPPYLAVIHRLDQPVSGILVFAKTPEAARRLNAQLQKDGFRKYYRALVCGAPKTPAGVLKDYLVKDGRTNTSRVCAPDTPRAKEAVLEYAVVSDEHFFQKTGENQMELDVRLRTGRHHQIRVQLSAALCPIAGDTKYNPMARETGLWQELKLCAYKLQFTHPFTKKPLSFELSEDVEN